MKLPLGRQHLKDAFNRHRALGTTLPHSPSDSHLLLLIYAVECGLKEMLLGRRGLHSTEKLAEDDLTHDLDFLLKILGARERFGFSRLTSPPTALVSSGNVHQALRYGARMEVNCRRDLEKHAKAVIAWIEENAT